KLGARLVAFAISRNSRRSQPCRDNDLARHEIDRHLLSVYRKRCRTSQAARPPEKGGRARAPKARATMGKHVRSLAAKHDCSTSSPVRVSATSSPGRSREKQNPNGLLSCGLRAAAHRQSCVRRAKS